ncbi:tumor susceptibility gene 101 protein [Bradysia coprophila]|uniref:tumor susceptibility gene 101 protein n=1 Tax=Bradysia coprophila TaxID=38358 RepID=UPI00187DBDF3|nr:tumor susceptibility gene 101 protein [Bradysia coprophila]
MVSGQDSNAISRLLSKYNNGAETKRDVVQILDMYRGLTYASECYVFNDGTSDNLFNINGTIPINYKNNTYNIPICIWLMSTHPSNAPICYVKPTPDMRIKVSRFVDHNGKIYLPYLHDWNGTDSDLIGLVQVMIMTFSDSPPLYSKPKETATPYPVQQSYMPQPGGGAGSSYPPYPVAGSNFPPYPANNYPGYPPAAGNFSSSPGYPPYMPNPSGYPPVSGYNTNTDTSGTGTITEQHIKASLISAVQDKLRRRITERVNQCQAEIETLNRTKMELSQGRAKIDSNISKLEQEESELKANITVLQDKQQSLEKSLESIDQENGIDVDEAVTTTAPLYKQLLNAYADEAATEDAIYYMGEALRNGVIDLDLFLKQVRQLSRKQFMLRALMQKCRQKAGLAG